MKGDSRSKNTIAPTGRPFRPAHGATPATIIELQVWHAGTDKFACVVGVITHADGDGDHFRQTLGNHEELV